MPGTGEEGSGELLVDGCIASVLHNEKRFGDGDGGLQHTVNVLNATEQHTLRW